MEWFLYREERERDTAVGKWGEGGIERIRERGRGRKREEGEGGDSESQFKRIRVVFTFGSPTKPIIPPFLKDTNHIYNTTIIIVHEDIFTSVM